MISRQVEEYLEAIARLEERGEAVTTSALAGERRVSPPSVTEMVRRLSDQGLVSYAPRGRIALTERGRAMARSLVRRHRLWERFLHDVLRVGWDRVYEEACRLEHVTSPVLEQQLSRAVGGSTTCPHGHAIPTENGRVTSPPSVSLVHLAPSQLARVASVREDNPGLLRQLASMGIRPGAVVEVLSTGPGAPDVFLRVGANSHSLPLESAREIEVIPIGPEEMAPRAAPLTELAPGETGVVEDVVAGKTFLARCLALGFTPGSPVVMVQNAGSGPMIVRVRQTRIALGRGEGRKIYVVRGAEPNGGPGKRQETQFDHVSIG